MTALLARPWSWVLLAAVVATSLAVGSVHAAPETRAARISYLESVIKCPVCDNISIAQSDAQQAQDLRARVVQLVDAGSSDQAVERYVVAQFGTDELLRPTSPVIWLLPIVGGALAVAGLFVALLRRRRMDASSVIVAADEALVAAARSASPGAASPGAAS